MQLLFYLHMFTLLHKCNKMFIPLQCYHHWFHVQRNGNYCFIYTCFLYSTSAKKCLYHSIFTIFGFISVIWQLFFIYTCLLYCTSAIKCLHHSILPPLVSCAVILQLFFYLHMFTLLHYCSKMFIPLQC